MIRLRFACSSYASLIVVGGHSRGVGKTSVVEHILRSRPEDETWAAVKVSAHRHAPASGAGPLVEETLRPSPLTQSGRYLLSGARRAFLCRTPDANLPETAAFVRGLLAEGTHVIVESNRLASLVEPDVLLFVVSPSVFDWKASSGPCLARADALVTGERAAAVPKAIAARGARLDGRPVFEMTRDRVVRGLDAWVDGRLNRKASPWPVWAIA